MRRWMMGWVPCVVVLLGVSVEPASGQYFGRQKVQYEDFDWRVLQTDHFDVHFYPEERIAIEDAARQSERWYTRLSLAFQHEFKKKPLILYADQPDFQQTNVIGGMLSEGTGGVTEALKNRVIMPFTGVYEDNHHVLGHELVHVFQYDLASAATGGGLMGLNRLPLWLVEGMAEYLSLGRQDAHTAMWLRDAALRGELPTIQQLTTDSRFFPYRYGQALWAYVAGRWGDRAVTEVFRAATKSGFEAALQRVLGVTSTQLSTDWHLAIRQAYIPLLEGRQRPEDAGTPVLVEKEAGAMNLSPAVSPDGRYVAFFGRREIFTVDLYVADAQTGRIVKKLTSPNRNAHFDALSFIQSAGTWSPDGRKFAFVVFNEGDNELAILDVGSADIERQIEVAGVGAIQNPAWSPDGNRIAFTGMAGGVSDLYVLDVASTSVQKLTNDRFAELEPAWSPDGRTIAIATDRVGTDFGTQTFGPMQLALIDATSGAARTLTLFPNRVKHINPQYSPDGRSLYFIADRNGFSDVYRTELASGRIFQVTRVATGVSGITDLAPALSVAAQTGRVMFSVFQNAGNNIYGLDAARAQGEQVEATSEEIPRAAILPPVNAFGTGLVAQYLQDVRGGLPPSDITFAEHDYRPAIKLDYLGAPSVGVGASTFGGAGLAGAVSGFFSDMLGDHAIGVAVQANGSLKDIGGLAQYLNSEHRWNYGAAVSHVPYVTGYVSAEPGVGNQPATLNETIERIFIDQVQASTRYGFSTTRRFELGAGFTRYSFDREVFRYPYDPVQDVILGQPTREEIDAPGAINFVETNASLVGDNSFFGLTSPVVGQRYRLMVSPTFGALTYQTVLADYRRYIMMRPMTFAVRGLHYGRYGSGASGLNDSGERLLSPVFLGYEDIIRGYARESLDVEKECPASTSFTQCEAFGRLYGTRLVSASAELRIPLLGVPELGVFNFPYLPVEVAPFFDVGYAWGNYNSATEPDVVGRKAVMSTGVSARVNVLGYIIVEAYYAYPFQRPEKGAHFGFQMMPGW